MDTTRRYPRTTTEAFPVSEGYHNAIEGPEYHPRPSVTSLLWLLAAVVAVVVLLLPGCGGGSPVLCSVTAAASAMAKDGAWATCDRAPTPSVDCAASGVCT